MAGGTAHSVAHVWHADVLRGPTLTDKGWPGAPGGEVDLVLGSPPYPLKGLRYSEGASKWQPKAWASWMYLVTRAMLQISRGPVCWVLNNPVKDSRYLPAVERLAVLLDDNGVTLERPLIWHKNAPPNRRDWFGNDWETILVAKRPGPVPFFDWKSVATPPKYKAGGHFRQRNQKGKRRRGSDYPQNALARPRDVLRFLVGGGHMGHPLAHKNEAPFPQSLAEFVVKCLCPKAGWVLDPFCGSGTTLAAALKLGRNAIGYDIREFLGTDQVIRHVAQVAEIKAQAKLSLQRLKS